jgi:hypothetical protein
MKKNIKQIKKYIRANFILALALCYFLFSSFLKIFFELDILLPCIWKKMFGSECYGCGLTTAFIEVLKCNFYEAYRINFLIYPVLTIALFVFIITILKFRKGTSNSD